MSPQSVLSGLRIGCVRYLNSKPLIYGLPGVRLEHPRDLAFALRAGELDAALVPVFEVLSAPEGTYQIVDGIGVGSHGPVYSVFVAHRADPEHWDCVVADPASLTSVHLLQVLIRLIFGRTLMVIHPDLASESQKQRARLWIGNQAIALRQSLSAGDPVQFWDLGEEWSKFTGLPFVYALWVLRRNTNEGRSTHIADAFREVARTGLESRKQIAEQETEFGFEFAQKYLGDWICFGIGEDQKAGITRFEQELRSGGLLVGARSMLDWV